jgi:tetratricopeptide (TPR) repeat protein
MSTVKKMKRFIYISFFSFLSLNAQKSINNTLEELSDKFQTNLFEALEQKGIENYEKAIELLIVCNNLNPNNAAVNFELGKNYYELDRELLAESSFIKADKLKPNNQWVLEGLYNLYRSQNNNFKTIETLQKLNKINQKYSITLVELYYKNNQHN